MDSIDASGITGIVWRRVDPAHEAEAEAVMRKLMVLARKSRGFLGSEIFPPVHGVQEAYVVLYRFDSGENFRAWLASPERQKHLEEIAAHLLEPAFEFFLAHRRHQSGTASSVFSYRIRPERQRDFEDWRLRILDEARKWEGFLGTESFDALDNSNHEFVVVVRFANRANLDAWLNCQPRAALMDEVRHYVERYDIRRIGSGFEGWFDTSDDRRPPAAWRQAVVILAALFPMITVLRHVLAPVFAALPLPAAFLILLTIDVALLTYVIMPHFSRLMNFWLRPSVPHSWRKEIAGWAVLLGLIAVTLTMAILL